jgi:hypothetical protein
MTCAGRPPERRLLSPDGRSYWDGARWVSLVSADGRQYWNGVKWVRQPEPERPPAPSVLRTAVVVVALLAGGVWFLNSTRLGVSIKCQYLNDVIACLQVAVNDLVPTAPRQPDARPLPATEDPAAVAHRQHQAAVTAAADALRTTTADVLSNARDVDGDAEAMSGSVADVEDALVDLGDANDALVRETSKKPMNGIQKDEVCFALDDVVFASESVEFEAESFGFDRETFDYNLGLRQELVTALSDAVASLRSLDGANTTWAPILLAGDAAITGSTETVESAKGRATEAQARVRDAREDARTTVDEAQDLAATVADC